MQPALLEVRDLTLSFLTPAGPISILRGVDLTISEGEIVGLVGESGSGKSLTCLSLLRLLGERARLGGRISFLGRDIGALAEHELVALRGREIAMIVQEPQSALNPVQTVGRQLVEAIGLSAANGGARGHDRAEQLLRDVGLPDPKARLSAYPHELSGGQAQRVLIAMMLARGPKLLLADEPTTALDVTVQAQILALLRRLRRDHGMAILLVTHDLGVVAETCDRVAVMYCGRIVESGPVGAIFRAPRHPYTVGLLGARPRIDHRVAKLVAMDGVVPDPRDLPPGCSFAPRCQRASARCAQVPPWQVDAVDRGFACHHPVGGDATP
ncbi:MAG: ABC transporter ATP-binding protein [Alphaproteobacteria bacterium]|nr:ABC transporter ATP-binding protein [Alphaproteobacteria bacterium]